MPWTFRQSVTVKRLFNHWKSLLIHKSLTDAFAASIRTGDKEKFNELIEGKSRVFIDKNYRDKNGNTLVHLVLLQSSFKWEELDGVLKMGSPFEWTNDAKQKPIDLCHKEWQKIRMNDSIKAKQKEQERKRSQLLEEPYWDLDEKGQGIRIAPGRYVTTDMELRYGSKTPSKECVIPDSWEELDNEDFLSLSLHERLAMSEPFIVSSTNTVSELQEEMAPSSSHSRNYVAVNIGFIVSDREHKSKGNHKRVFVTLPIDDPSYSIIKNRGFFDVFMGPHSEETLYDYLKDDLIVKQIVNVLSIMLRSKYKTYKGHKVYAVILDLHSSRDMCEGCEQETYHLQGSREEGGFLTKLEKTLVEYGFVLPKEKAHFPEVLTPKSQRLKVVTRVSSSMTNTFQGKRPYQNVRSREYSYPIFFKIQPVKIDEKSHLESKDKKDNALVDAPANFDRDIRKFANSVILHDGELPSYKKYGRFYRKESYGKLESLSGFFALPQRTLFANTNNQTKSQSKLTLRVNTQGLVVESQEKTVTTATKS